jgi:hypothetical protein
MEKLWLVIFNYKKHNKNYIKLIVKDYPLYTYNLTINNNYIRFKLFSITCELFLNLIIDNHKYLIEIRKNIIYLKYFNKTKLYINPIHNKEIQNAIKDFNYMIVKIKLDNNILLVIINNIIIINYQFKYNVNKIEDVKIFSITDNNNLIDLLNPKLVKRELGNYNNIVNVVLF